MQRNTDSSQRLPTEIEIMETLPECDTPMTSKSECVDLQVQRSLVARHDIQDTHSLIKAFNEADPDSEERELFLNWLKSYNVLFSKHGDELEDEEIESYSCLAGMKCFSHSERGVVKTCFLNLCKKTSQDPYCSTSILAALEHALSTIELDVLRGCPSKLVRLAKNLLSSIDPSQTSHSRLFYKEHLVTLFVLHRTIERLFELDSNALTHNMVQQFIEKLKDIEEKEEYFPYFFHARLMRFSLKGFEAGNFMAPLMRAGRCIYLCLWGGFHFIQGLRELVDFKFDFTAIEAGWTYIKEALSLSEEGKWLSELSMLVDATKETILEENFERFKACFDALIAKPSWNVINKKSHKISKFGLVVQLRLLAMDGPSEDIRTSAKNELLKLASLPRKDQWIRDPDIFEALIDGLRAIQRFREDDPRPCVLLERLRVVEDDLLKQRFNEWEEMVKREEESIEKSIRLDILFIKAREETKARLITQKAKENVERLSTLYFDRKFQEVYTLLQNKENANDFRSLLQNQHSTDALDCHLETIMKFVASIVRQDFQKMGLPLMLDKLSLGGERRIQIPHEICELVDRRPLDVVGEQYIFFKRKLADGFPSLSDNDINCEIQYYQPCMELVESAAMLNLIWGIRSGKDVFKMPDQIPHLFQKFPEITLPVFFALVNFKEMLFLNKSIKFTLQKLWGSVVALIKELKKSFDKDEEPNVIIEEITEEPETGKGGGIVKSNERTKVDFEGLLIALTKMAFTAVLRLHPKEVAFLTIPVLLKLETMVPGRLKRWQKLHLMKYKPKPKEKPLRCSSQFWQELVTATVESIKEKLVESNFDTIRPLVEEESLSPCFTFGQLSKRISFSSYQGSVDTSWIGGDDKPDIEEIETMESESNKEAPKISETAPHPIPKPQAILSTLNEENPFVETNVPVRGPSRMSEPAWPQTSTARTISPKVDDEDPVAATIVPTREPPKISDHTCPRTSTAQTVPSTSNESSPDVSTIMSTKKPQKTSGQSLAQFLISQLMAPTTSGINISVMTIMPVKPGFIKRSILSSRSPEISGSSTSIGNQPMSSSIAPSEAQPKVSESAANLSSTQTTSSSTNTSIAMPTPVDPQQTALPLPPSCFSKDEGELSPLQTSNNRKSSITIVSVGIVSAKRRVNSSSQSQK